MSHESFQHALALLIRLPEDNRNDKLPAFLADFDLTADEYSKLETLAIDPNVTKYGRIMRGARWDGLMRQMKLLPSFLHIGVLEDLCLQKFDPTAPDARSQWYPVKFMEWLLDDAQAQAILRRNAPTYINDIIKYEHAQLLFRKQVLDRRSPLPADTLLQHRCCVVLRLNYDVNSIMQKVAEIEGSDLRDHKPEPEAKIFLMVGDLVIPKHRMFEVDDETASFIETLLDAYDHQQPVPMDLALPESYDDLVELGLIRAVTKH